MDRSNKDSSLKATADSRHRPADSDYATDTEAYMPDIIATGVCVM